MTKKQQAELKKDYNFLINEIIISKLLLNNNKQTKSKVL